LQLKFFNESVKNSFHNQDILLFLVKSLSNVKSYNDTLKILHYAHNIDNKYAKIWCEIGFIRE